MPSEEDNQGDDNGEWYIMHVLFFNYLLLCFQIYSGINNLIIKFIMFLVFNISYEILLIFWLDDIIKCYV